MMEGAKHVCRLDVIDKAPVAFEIALLLGPSKRNFGNRTLQSGNSGDGGRGSTDLAELISRLGSSKTGLRLDPRASSSSGTRERKGAVMT